MNVTRLHVVRRTLVHVIGSFFLTGCLAASTLASGCSPPPEPAQSARGPRLPPPGPDQEYDVAFPKGPPPAWRYIRLALGDDLSRDCGLIRAHFELDSAEPLPQDQIALGDVADCLNRPDMRDRDVEVVGRADSRGDAAYNLDLGRRRAESVKSTLVAGGIDEERIHTSSAGERRALGDEGGAYSYGYDRRADVTIRATPHRPGRR